MKNTFDLRPPNNECLKMPISYALKNGDVVSILTGEGRPSTEWMRFAKSRSTRSKLRQYFRSQQRSCIRKSGEMIFFDYLLQNRDVIVQNSYLGDACTEVPCDVEELAAFLPGKSHYTDPEELLFHVGKNHNPNFLRTKVSKIFLVPLKVLEACDESRFDNITRSVYEAQMDDVAILEEINDDEEDLSGLLNGGAHELADVDSICEHCLPVRGDTIVGTRPSGYDGAATVHRYECPLAQRAVNSAKPDVLEGVNGSTLMPVQLVWSDEEVWEEDSNLESYLAEIKIMANDRKLLLADCSVIASKNSEILKTGSSSSSEHCILEFLVRVSDLDELQLLMNKLREVPSVMSVERRVSDLADRQIIVFVYPYSCLLPLQVRE